MTAAKRMDIRNYCDSLYTELSGMKSRLNDFIVQIQHLEGKDREALGSHEDHLREIVKTIDWKLEILIRVCPFDWKGYSEEVEDQASVPLTEPGKAGKQTPGGYVGG